MKKKINRQKWGALQIGNWKDNEWLPEQIIQYYGPATWAEDRSWGYRTPIYMSTTSSAYRLLLKL
jgi:hypothetical protein